MKIGFPSSSIASVPSQRGGIANDVAQSFKNVLENLHEVEGEARSYVAGQKDIAQVALSMSQVAVEVEAVKSIAESGINAVKSILNTNI